MIDELAEVYNHLCDWEETAHRQLKLAQEFDDNNWMSYCEGQLCIIEMMKSHIEKLAPYLKKCDTMESSEDEK